MTASPNFLVLRSSMTVSRTKFEGRGSKGNFAATSVDGFAGFMHNYSITSDLRERREQGCRLIFAVVIKINPTLALGRDRLRAESLPRVRVCRQTAQMG